MNSTKLWGFFISVIFFLVSVKNIALAVFFFLGFLGLYLHRLALIAFGSQLFIYFLILVKKKKLNFMFLTYFIFVEFIGTNCVILWSGKKN